MSEDITPKPPVYCRQCGHPEFDWYGVAAFKCKGCEDVAHWLSNEQRQSIRVALEAPKGEQHGG